MPSSPQSHSVVINSNKRLRCQVTKNLTRLSSRVNSCEEATPVRYYAGHNGLYFITVELVEWSASQYPAGVCSLRAIHPYRWTTVFTRFSAWLLVHELAWFSPHALGWRAFDLPEQADNRYQAQFTNFTAIFNHSYMSGITRLACTTHRIPAITATIRRCSSWQWEEATMR